MIVLRPGQFVKFTYTGSKSNQFKDVFVLNPNWKNRVHALDLKLMTEAEREVLRAIMNANKTRKAGQHPLPLVNDILNRIEEPRQSMRNAQAFYNRFVKPFIRGRDIYRKYDPSFIVNAQIYRPSHVPGGEVYNPAPLFGGHENKSVFDVGVPSQEKDAWQPVVAPKVKKKDRGNVMTVRGRPKKKP